MNLNEDIGPQIDAACASLRGVLNAYEHLEHSQTAESEALYQRELEAFRRMLNGR